MSRKTKEFFAAFGSYVALGFGLILLFGIMLAIVAVIATLFQIGQWLLGIIAIVVALLIIAALAAWSDI